MTRFEKMEKNKVKKEKGFRADVCLRREVLFEKYSFKTALESLFLKELQKTKRMYRYNKEYGGYYIYKLKTKDESFDSLFELDLYDEGNIFYIKQRSCIKKTIKNFKTIDIEKAAELLRKKAEKHTGFSIKELKVFGLHY